MCSRCGSIGHYAEACSSAERLCYNCKQPGEHLMILEILQKLTLGQATSPTLALFPGPPKPSSATTARDSGTSRLTAPPFVSPERQLQEDATAAVTSVTWPGTALFPALEDSAGVPQLSVADMLPVGSVEDTLLDLALLATSAVDPTTTPATARPRP